MIKLTKIKIKDNKEMDKMMSMDMSMPPYLNLNSEQFPEIKDWEVGDTYTMIIEVKQTSKNENKDGTVNGSFDITAYKANAESDTENMSDKDLEDMQAKGLSS